MEKALFLHFFKVSIVHLLLFLIALSLEKIIVLEKVWKKYKPCILFVVFDNHRDSAFATI